MSLVFYGPIDNENNIEMHSFYPHAPEIIYVQYYNNTCFLISLASYFFDANENVAEHDVVSWFLSYLSCDNIGFKNSIKFDSDILTDCVRNKGEKQCRYKLIHWKIKGSFEICNDISDHVTLFQLIDTAVNFNHAMSITGSWIYDYNNKNPSVWWNNS